MEHRDGLFRYTRQGGTKRTVPAFQSTAIPATEPKTTSTEQPQVYHTSVLFSITVEKSVFLPVSRRFSAVLQRIYL
jgi:hypothetical protein